VVGVSTLEAYARAAGQLTGVVVPVLDARRGEVYAAAYRWQHDELVPVFGPLACTPDDLAARLSEPTTLIGDGVDAYMDRWADVAAVVDARRLADCPPSGAMIARMGAGSPLSAEADLEPRYCRLPAAQLQRTGPVALSLGISVEN
jgi:tRNA threonylcarbamoyladenosine biosynthesis protein TsaB